MKNTTTILKNVATTQVSTIFLRRKYGKAVAYSILVLWFGNLIYQIHIPSHLECNNAESFTYPMPWYPMPFEIGWPFGEFAREVIDLTSTDKSPISKSVIVCHAPLNDDAES